MSNEDLLPEDNQVSDYQERALRMMNPYKQHKQALFYIWLNEFEYVADIIGVPDDKMVDLFTKMMQHDVRNSEPGINYCKLSYDQILTHYIKLLTDIPKYQFYRKRFMCRDQYEQETFLNYAICLRKIIDKCRYKTGLEERLCKQFINGIRDDKIRTEIEKFDDLSFDETVAAAADSANLNEITTYVNITENINYIHALDRKVHRIIL